MDSGPSSKPAPATQRAVIWMGVLELVSNNIGELPRVTEHLPCKVSAISKNIDELKVDTWPSKLTMQVIPKSLITNIEVLPYLKDCKTVLFQLQPNKTVAALTKVMVNGFVGSVHFSGNPQCDVKVLIIVNLADTNAFIGLIPNNQEAFIDLTRKAIQQQKLMKAFNKLQI